MKPQKDCFYLEFDPEYGKFFQNRELSYICNPPGAVEFLKKPTKNKIILVWEFNGNVYFIKKFFECRIKEKFGPFNEWKQIYNLRRSGIRTVDPVLFGYHYGERFAILVTKKAPGYSLEKWVQERKCACFDKVVSSLATFAADFHKKGFTHQDFYFAHLFWDEESEAISVIDLQRVVRISASDFLKLVNIFRIVKDIAQLLYSASFFLDDKSYREFCNIFWDGYTRYIPKFSNSLIKKLIELKRRKIARHDRKIKSRRAEFRFS